MRVAGPLPTLQLTSAPTSAWQRTLAPGQVLNAVVVGPTAPGSMLLRVGALELIARTELDLSQGQSILLRVIRGGETPELQVVQASRDQALIAQALRTSLPRQADLAELLGRMAATWRELPNPNAAPQPLAREIGAILNRVLPTGADPADLKGQLLRLLTRLQISSHRPAPLSADRGEPGSQGAPAAGGRPEAAVLDALRQETESALASIRWQQISSLPDEIGRGPVWHLELPLRAPDGSPAGLWLRAQRDADGREPGNPRWTIDLSLTVEPLGPLHARLSLLGGQLSATLWAERDRTTALINEHLALLGAGLERSGIQVAHLAARAGRPTTTADQPVSPLRGLLDERA